MFDDINNGHTCYCENCFKLQSENDILRHTIHEWQHDCNNKRGKLEKIKEYCNKTFHDGVWNGFLMDEEHRVNILKIIESEE